MKSEGDKMKNKILYTEITTAIDELARALRKYSGGPMFCRIELLTHDEDQDAEAPDLYTFGIHPGNSDEIVMSEGGWIYRDSDNKIIKVKRIGDGGAS